ncbi:MAG: hypothetical protein OXH11_19365 [Candidatus Aminicenantes bacterium]|nr:hypothetical protein [Candidatus Aminicenantes bacterium]
MRVDPEKEVQAWCRDCRWERLRWGEEAERVTRWAYNHSVSTGHSVEVKQTKMFAYRKTV